MNDNELLQAISGLFDKRITPIEQQLENVVRDIKDIRLTLENETNRNIMRVAEGHLDISRKLDEALKVENEKEMLVIRVNILENELRKVKDKLSTIA